MLGSTENVDGLESSCFWLRFLVEERLHLTCLAISTALGRQGDQTSWGQHALSVKLCWSQTPVERGFPSDFTQFCAPRALSKTSVAEKTRSHQEARQVEGGLDVGESQSWDSKQTFGHRGLQPKGDPAPLPGVRRMMTRMTRA